MLKNSLYSLISRLSTAFLKLGSYLYLAKVMDIVDYGMFSFYMAIIYITSMGLLFGMNNSLLQIYAPINNKKLKELIIYYSKVISFVIAIFAFIFSSVIFSFFYSETYALILSFAISSQLLFMMAQSINLVENKMKRYIFLPIIQLCLFFIFILLMEDYHSISVIQMYSLSCLIAVLVLLPKQLREIKRKVFLIVLSKLWKYGIKHLMFEINNILINRSDVLILKMFGLDTMLGYYAIIKNMIEGLMYLPKSLQPVILKDFNTSQEKLFKKINLLLTLFYLSILIFFVLFGEKIITFIWNYHYLFIYELLMLYLFGFIFYSLGVLNSYKLLNFKLFNEAIKTNIFYAVILLVGNLIGIKISERFGIGVTYVTCSIFYYVYTQYILKRSVSS